MIRRSLAMALAWATVAGAAVEAQTSQRIVAFGDSITFGFGDDPGRGGYPARLANLLTTPDKSFGVENEGVSGETSAEGLSRLSTLSGSGTDEIILMEGTNDTFQSISPETIAQNLIAMAKKARSRGFAKVYLATVAPIGVTSSGSRFNNSIFLTDEIRQAAYDEKLPMPDPHQGFYDIENFFADLYIGDGIHPNASGYDELARMFAEYLRGEDTIAPAASFVFPRHDSSGVPEDSLLQVVVFDPLSGVDQATATLTVNGVAVTTEVSGDAKRTVLRAQPGNLKGKTTLGVDVRDAATPPNRRTSGVSVFTAVDTQFLTGDINLSGRVDGADLVLLSYSFGSQAGQSRYRSSADLTKDGVVDGDDLAQLAANFGRSSS